MSILHLLLTTELLLYSLLNIVVSFDYLYVYDNEPSGKSNNQKSSSSVIFYFSLLLSIVIILFLLFTFNLASKLNVLLFIFFLIFCVNHLIKIYKSPNPLQKYDFNQTSIIGVFAFFFGSIDSSGVYYSVHTYCSHLENQNIHDFILVMAIFFFLSYIFFLSWHLYQR